MSWSPRASSRRSLPSSGPAARLDHSHAARPLGHAAHRRDSCVGVSVRGLIVARVCRGDREKKFAQVFAAAKLDGAAMSTMNGRAVEVAVRNATQGEGWVDDLQKVVVRAHFCGKLERICAGARGCRASCPYSCDSVTLLLSSPLPCSHLSTNRMKS